MDSDTDSVIDDSPRRSSPPATQNCGISKVQYAWVIVFTMNVDRDAPFNIIRLTHFKNSDFPWNGITEEMNEEFRTCQRTFSNMPGNKYCIFAKVEKGTYLFILLVVIYYRDENE